VTALPIPGVPPKLVSKVGSTVTLKYSASSHAGALRVAVALVLVVIATLVTVGRTQFPSTVKSAATSGVIALLKLATMAVGIEAGELSGPTNAEAGVTLTI
jgi:hypothetical protein